MWSVLWGCPCIHEDFSNFSPSECTSRYGSPIVDIKWHESVSNASKHLVTADSHVVRIWDPQTVSTDPPFTLLFSVQEKWFFLVFISPWASSQCCDISSSYCPVHSSLSSFHYAPFFFLLTFLSICWVWYWNMENWYAGEWDDQYRGSSGRDQWRVCGAQEWSYIYGSRLSSNPLFFHPFTWASSTLVLFPWKSHSMSESHLCIYEKSI